MMLKYLYHSFLNVFFIASKICGLGHIHSDLLIVWHMWWCLFNAFKVCYVATVLLKDVFGVRLWVRRRGLVTASPPEWLAHRDNVLHSSSIVYMPEVTYMTLSSVWSGFANNQAVQLHQFLQANLVSAEMTFPDAHLEWDVIECKNSPIAPSWRSHMI